MKLPEEEKPDFFAFSSTRRSLNSSICAALKSRYRVRYWCGVLPVWICFTVLIASLLLLAFRFGLAREARLYLLGAAALVGIQTLVHISVNLCLLPTTGLTLPLISYGGSSLFGCCLLLGIALSAANETE